MEGVIGGNTQKSGDEDEQSGCGGEDGCQNREAFEAEWWGGIEPREGLVTEDEEEGGETDDTGEDE